MLGAFDSLSFLFSLIIVPRAYWGSNNEVKEGSKEGENPPTSDHKVVKLYFGISPSINQAAIKAVIFQLIKRG